MPRVAEEEEASKEEELTLPPTPFLLPSALLLTVEQTKRRHIIANLVHRYLPPPGTYFSPLLPSENNYVASLQRLVTDYRRPLEESSPPILSTPKVTKAFRARRTLAP